MSDAQPGATEMQAQYAAQVAADLETNRKEQEHVRTEVAALQEQLQTLEDDHAVLLSMQQALGSSSGAPATATGTAKAPSRSRKNVPVPRAGADKAGAARTKKSTATGTKGKAAKNAPKPAAKGAPGTTTAAAAKKPDAPAAGPTLVELIDAHLGQQSEPRSAAEITAALSQAHPDRSIKTTVVRTTVENLVARGRAQRTKQGSSVFYTSGGRSEQSDAPQPETAAAN
ncbi:hypothetical protein [Streptomyces longisporoflavus]|uniref:Regulatory protein n=1 Tax=Streptomyces longisporoflavus TaxID=28044 RepID=A0ABW7QQ47_9ACTN